jgi:monoamine oxidase
MALSRRRFIEELAMIGGLSLAFAGMDALGFGIASAQAAPPRLAGRKGTKVVILGAGLAGMTAAYELTKAGYEVEVIEARPYAGGRCQTARKGFTNTDLLGHTQTCDFDEGLYINHGPWRIPYQHRSTLHYTKLFGVELQAFVNDNDNSWVYFEQGAAGPLGGKRLRKGQVGEDMAGYAGEILAKCVGRGGLDARLSPEDREKFLAYVVAEGRLDRKTLAYSGSEGRGFDIPHGAGVDPGPGKVSTPYAFADILHSNAWKALRPVNEYEMQLTMFQPVGGMDHIAKGFERNVGRLIRYSTEARKIVQDGSGVEVFFVSTDGQAGSIKADYCVCTIPLSVLRGVDAAFSPTFKAAMADVAYTPVNKIGLQMKRRFWEEDDAIYGGHVYTDMKGVGSMSLPSYGWQGEKGVILGYYEFGAAAAQISARSPADRAAFAVASGQKVFPQYAENFETAYSHSWHLEKYNLGGWAEWDEAGRANAYPILCKPDGRIYLSGEHLSYLGGWQAGAIESAWSQIAALDARVNAA